jgi:hypothetical protein
VRLDDSSRAKDSPDVGASPNAETVLARLEEAGRAFARMPASRCFPADVRCAWPEPLQETMDAYGWTEADARPSPPTAAEVDRMDEAFGWIGLIPLDRRVPGSGELARVHGGGIRRRLVWHRTRWNLRRDEPLLSWRAIGRIEHCDHKSAESWHARGLDEIVAGLRRAERDVLAGLDRAATRLQIARILGPRKPHGPA